MSATHELIKSAIAADVDAPTLASIDTIPEDMLSRMVADAVGAKAALDAGDRDSAVAIMLPYRQMAEQFGLEALYDAFIDGAM